MIAIPFTFPGVPGVRCAFGTGQARPNGPATPEANMAFAVSGDPEAVRRARLALRHALGFAAWHSLKQVHGTDMVFEPEDDTLLAPSLRAGDGLATSRPGLALAIKTADCQPILLAHVSGRFVAALHVGWRGNVMDFPGKGVRTFCRHYGFDPAEVFAVRGPSLGPSAAQFVHFEQEFGPAFAPYFDEATRTVNLWRLTRDQLVAAGLPLEHVFGLDLCTRSLPQFFSHRRDKAAGRQVSLIWIDPD